MAQFVGRPTQYQTLCDNSPQEWFVIERMGSHPVRAILARLQNSSRMGHHSWNSRLVSASAVLTAVRPLLGPFLWVWSRRGSDLGNSDAGPPAPSPARSAGSPCSLFCGGLRRSSLMLGTLTQGGIQ